MSRGDWRLAALTPSSHPVLHQVSSLAPGITGISTYTVQLSCSIIVIVIPQTDSLLLPTIILPAITLARPPRCILSL